MQIYMTLGHRLRAPPCRSSIPALQQSWRSLAHAQFAIIDEGPGISGSTFASVAEKLLQRLSEPVVLGGEPTTVTPSIGVAFGPESTMDADELLRRADDAMYAAKRRGKACYQVFRPSALAA